MDAKRKSARDSPQLRGGKKAFMTDVSFVKHAELTRSKQRQQPRKPEAPLKKLRSQELRQRRRRTRLPKISNSLKQKRKAKGRAKENIARDLQSFVGKFDREFRNRREEAKDPRRATQNSLFGKKAKIDCVERFLNHQEVKARKNVKSVYRRLAQNSEADLAQILSRMENKASFQQLLKMKEEELILTKKKFNQVNFELGRAQDSLKGLDRRIRQEELAQQDVTNEGSINAAIQNERDLNDNLEEVRLVTESLVHKKKMYSADILTLKKNTETLKTHLRRWKKIRSDLDRKRNTNIKLSNHLLEKLLSAKKKRGDTSEVFGTSKNLKTLFHNELELFRDKIILEEMIRRKDDDGGLTRPLRAPAPRAAGEGAPGTADAGLAAQKPGPGRANRAPAVGSGRARGAHCGGAQAA